MADILKQQKQALLNQINIVPNSKKLSDDELMYMDYQKLPIKEINLLEKISFFSIHRTMLKMLQNELGQGTNKEQFIRDHINFLTTNESVQFSTNKIFYRLHTVTIPTYLTLFCTISAFLIALWRLPSRMSTVKYTLVGMTTGVVLSYAQWKYSMFQYYNKLNRLFRTIIKERYQPNRVK